MGLINRYVSSRDCLTRVQGLSMLGVKNKSATPEGESMDAFDCVDKACLVHVA